MKKPSLSTLKNNLWKIFSQYMRRRDADENGMVKCITCPKVAHWKEMDGGHCLPKGLGLSIYFDERNVRPQCSYCNLAEQGNQSIFFRELKKIYGEEIEEELRAQQKNIRQIKRWEYVELIEKYKQKLKDLDGMIFGARG